MLALFTRQSRKQQMVWACFTADRLRSTLQKNGDILQNNRSGNSFDFAFAATHKSYESHSAVVMDVGSDTRGKYLRTVGGNESDSVGMKEVRLNAKGLVGQGRIYIAVIETLL